MLRTRTVLVLALLLASACGGSSGTTRTNGGGDRQSGSGGDKTTTRAAEPDEAAKAEAARLLTMAEAARATGDVVAVRRILHRIVRETGGTAPEAEARVRLAEGALEREDPGAAEVWLTPLGDPSKSDEAVRTRHRRALALAYEGQERYAEAAKIWLAGVGDAGEDEAAAQEATEGAARSQFLDGRPADAREVLKQGGAEPERVRELVTGRLSGRVLAELLEKVPDGDADRAWLALQAARAACDGGDLPGCRDGAQQAATSNEEPVRAEAEALLGRVAAWDKVSARHVGVLLPLSGPYQQIGQAALEGIQIALGGDKSVRLVVRDTKGKPDVAAAQVEKLVLERNVVALLGPVGERETRAAAEAAARFAVPHVALTSTASAVEGFSRTLRVRMAAPEQATALARYAVTTLDTQRVGILFPESTAGARVMGAFWDEVVRLGGEVRAVESYPEGTKKFSPVIKALIAAPKPGKGTVDFDALFIPDDALSVRRLVPFLKYWGIRTKTAPHVKGTKKRPAVQLLGAAGWNHASVVDKGDNLTDNAVFVDAFVHDPDDPASDRFARTFFGRYRRKPTTFHAEVRDAALLLAKAVKKAEGDTHATRDALWTGLLGQKHFRGVTGDLTLFEDGRVARKPRLLTIHLDDIRARLTEEEEAWLRKKPGPGAR